MAEFDDLDQPPADMVDLVSELPAALPIPVRARTPAVRLVHQDLHLVGGNIIIFHFKRITGMSGPSF